MKIGSHEAPGWHRPLAAAMAMLLALGGGAPAVAEDLESMQRRAADLIRELEGELQAVRTRAAGAAAGARGPAAG